MDEIREGCPKKNGVSKAPVTAPPPPPKPQPRREPFDPGMTYYNHHVMRARIDRMVAMGYCD